jgi:molybdopterin biosynthesis enzyme
MQVLLGEDVQLAAPLTHYLRGVLTADSDGRITGTLTGPQSSGMLTSMAAADALLVLGGDRLAVQAGTVVPAIVLDGDLRGSERFPG